MIKNNKPIFDIFKSNKEKESTQEEGKGTVEVTNNVEETEPEIDKKDNNSVEEVTNNNTTKEKNDIELYTPYIIIMILIIIIVKLRSKLRKK